MAYARPDLSNLRMESLEDFMPRSSLSKTPPPPAKSQPPPAKSSPPPATTTQSSLESKTATPPPPETSNNPWLSSALSAHSPISGSRTPPHPLKTETPPPEKSNNPYISNNPWLSSTTPTNSRPPSRPGLTRYESHSLDLPRADPAPTSVEFETGTVSTQKSTSLASRKEDNVAAAFGLGHLKDVNEFIEYAVWNASLTNMRICPLDLSNREGKYFYVAHRSFLPNRPGVVIHSGSTKDGAVLAVAHLDTFSTSNSLGIGDPQTAPIDVVWEKLHKESFWTHMRYSFEWDVEVHRKGLTETERHVYEWHRTKNNFLWDDQGDLVLVKKGDDEVLALYEGKGPMGQLPGKRRGTLRIKPRSEGQKEGWECVVMLGWASVVELSRRRARQRRISSILGHI